MGWLTRHTLAQRLTSISGYNEIPGRFPSSFTVKVVFFFASTNPQRTGGQGGGSRGMSFFPLSARRKNKMVKLGGAGVQDMVRERLRRDTIILTLRLRDRPFPSLFRG